MILNFFISDNMLIKTINRLISVIKRLEDELKAQVSLIF